MRLNKFSRFTSPGRGWRCKGFVIRHLWIFSIDFLEHIP